MTVLRCENLSDARLQATRRRNISNNWYRPQSLFLAIFDFSVFDIGSRLLTILVNDPDRSSVSWRIRSSLYGFVTKRCGCLWPGGLGEETERVPASAVREWLRIVRWC